MDFGYSPQGYGYSPQGYPPQGYPPYPPQGYSPYPPQAYPPPPCAGSYNKWHHDHGNALSPGYRPAYGPSCSPEYPQYQNAGPGQAYSSARPYQQTPVGGQPYYQHQPADQYRQAPVPDTPPPIGGQPYYPHQPATQYRQAPIPGKSLYRAGVALLQAGSGLANVPTSVVANVVSTVWGFSN